MVLFNEKVVLNGVEHHVRLAYDGSCVVNARFDAGSDFVVKDAGGVPTRVPRVVLYEQLEFVDSSATKRFVGICVKRAARQHFPRKTFFRAKCRK